MDLERAGVLPTSLVLHGKPVASVYSLIGQDENALTFALGHCLSADLSLAREFLRLLGLKHLREGALKTLKIELQKHAKEDRGYSDVELTLPRRFRIIIEAKIGYGTPNDTQLRKYKVRLDGSIEPKKILCVLVERHLDHVRKHVREVTALEDTSVLSWNKVRDIIKEAARRRDPSPYTVQMDAFLREAYDLPEQFEHEVWVVPVSTQRWVSKDRGIRLCDEPSKLGWYIFPTKYKPKKTLYLGYRYDGQVKGIRRILQERPVASHAEVIDGADQSEPEELTAYSLGPPLPLPREPIKTAGFRDTRVYCDLDLLLTSATLKVALELTRERRRRKAAEE